MCVCACVCVYVHLHYCRIKGFHSKISILSVPYCLESRATRSGARTRPRRTLCCVGASPLAVATRSNALIERTARAAVRRSMRFSLRLHPLIRLRGFSERCSFSSPTRFSMRMQAAIAVFTASVHRNKLPSGSATRCCHCMNELHVDLLLIVVSSIRRQRFAKRERERERGIRAHVYTRVRGCRVLLLIKNIKSEKEYSSSGQRHTDIDVFPQEKVTVNVHMYSDETRSRSQPSLLTPLSHLHLLLLHSVESITTGTQAPLTTTI